MGKEPEAGIVFLSARQLADPACALALRADALPFYRTIAAWITGYLMRSHPELGRPGEVCPFTARAYQLDTIRIGVSLAAADDGAAVKENMRDCLQQFRSIACDKPTRHLRTVVVGFPNLDGEDGLAALKAAQGHLKLRCLWEGLMVGRFHSRSQDEGLWNRDFRPMRAPIPLIAVRHLVRNDAPFALRNPVLFASYLCRYSVSAPRYLLANFAKQRDRRDERAREAAAPLGEAPAPPGAVTRSPP
jgi:hypothetical protein